MVSSRQVLSRLIKNSHRRNGCKQSSALNFGGCTTLYLSFLLAGTRLLGEEGDYTLFAVLFLLFNVLIFQLLRLEKNRFAYGIFVMLFSVSAIVVGLQTLITTSYLFTTLLNRQPFADNSPCP
jgi:hypothetical protein